MACLDRRHSFETLRAVADIGVDVDFVTGFVAGPITSRLSPRLARYTMAPHASVAVRSTPDLYLLPRAVARSCPPSRKARIDEWMERRFDDRVSRILAAGSYDVFHGFARYAANSLERARSLGVETILDLPELPPAVFRRIASEEAEQWGVPTTLPHESLESQNRREREILTADRIIVGLESVRDALIDEMGVHEQQIHVIPYLSGLDAARGRSVGGTVRAAPTLARGPLRVLFVGVLSWVKGLHRLLDAVAGMAPNDVELVVVGRDFDEWSPVLRERMAAMNNVTHIDGLPQRELHRLMREFHVLAFPSLVGGVGLVVYEALSQGLPVVVSSREGIIGPRASVEVDPRDSHAIRLVLEELRGSPERLKALAKNAPEEWDRLASYDTSSLWSHGYGSLKRANGLQ
jgi:glycosyltransferase involved in cell wall biosynthesis